MTAIERMQQRVRALERSQLRATSAERAIRISNTLTGLRRFRETIVRSAASTTHTPFPRA